MRRGSHSSSSESSIFFVCLPALAIVVRRIVDADDIVAQTEANGYKRGKYKEQDAIGDLHKHVEKTKKDQDAALSRYVLYVHSYSLRRRRPADIGFLAGILARCRGTVPRKGSLAPVKP